MKNAGDPHGIGEGPSGRGLSDLPHPNHMGHVEDLHQFTQTRVTGCRQSRPLVRGKFVRRAVATALFHESQRAPIPDKVRRGERIGGAKPLLHEPPKPATRHLTLGTRESLDWPIRMGIPGGDHFPLQLQKRPDCAHLAKRHPGLRHAPWAWVHAQKQTADPLPSKPLEVRLVGCTSMVKWARDMGDWRRKPKRSGGRGGFSRAGHNLLSDGGRVRHCGRWRA